MKPTILLAGIAVVAIAGPLLAQQLPRTPRSAFGELRANLPPTPGEAVPPLGLDVVPAVAVDDGPPKFNTESAKAFAPRILPVLANACANCHARKDHASRFKMRYTSGDYADSEAATANLNAALRMIARERPAESPLLVKAVTPHGGAKEPPLRGRANPAFRNLELWIHWAAAPEGSGMPDVPPTAATVQPLQPNPNPPSLLELTGERKAASVPRVELPASGPATHLVLGPKEPGQLPSLPRAEPLTPGGFATGPRTPSTDPTQVNRADEFDPAAFNRAMHPGRK